jgi:hypothetical protein
MNKFFLIGVRRFVPYIEEDTPITAYSLRGRDPWATSVAITMPNG